MGHSGGFSVHAGVRVAVQYSAGHDRLLYIAGVDAEPIPELEFARHWGDNPAQKRWHVRRSADWCGPGASVVLRVV